MDMANTFRKLPTRAVLLLAAALMAACAPPTEDDYIPFVTAEEAFLGLVVALEEGDPVTLGRLLGPGSDELISSGDPVADKAGREAFLAAYREKHELVPDGDDRQVLVIGAQDWPVPIPAVRKEGRWRLDGAAGADELIYRRVGANELGAIAVARGFVDAQREYAAEARDGNPAGVFAQKLLSDPDRQDGYHYRLLFGQGPAANGGAMNYLADGLLTRGFALIAWPATYGASGVKTFIVNQDGVVYEKDLGDDTATLVDGIQDFDPDSSWTPVVDAPGA